MTLVQKFQSTLQQYERALADTQKSYLPHLKTAIETLNNSGAFKVELLLAQSGSVYLHAKQPSWRENYLVMLTEQSLDESFRTAPQEAATNMADMIVTELAHTLARSQRAAYMKYMLGR